MYDGGDCGVATQVVVVIDDDNGTSITDQW